MGSELAVRHRGSTSQTFGSSTVGRGPVPVYRAVFVASIPGETVVQLPARQAPDDDFPEAGTPEAAALPCVMPGRRSSFGAVRTQRLRTRSVWEAFHIDTDGTARIRFGVQDGAAPFPGSFPHGQPRDVDRCRQGI